MVNNSEAERLRSMLAELSEPTDDEPEELEFPPKSRKANYNNFFNQGPLERDATPPKPTYVQEKDLIDNSHRFHIGDIYDGGYGWAHLEIQAIPKPTYRD